MPKRMRTDGWRRPAGASSIAGRWPDRRASSPPKPRDRWWRPPGLPTCTSYSLVIHFGVKRGNKQANMTAPVSVRLDDDVRQTLEAEARARHVGLSTYLRQIA